MNQIFPRNLSALTARAVGERILGGVYSPGELLPDENALSREFSVSRTVVREAVKTLAAKGLIEVRPKVGTRILSKDTWQLLDREMLGWQQNMSVNHSRLQQLMEVRQTIEPVAAKLAAERRTAKDLEGIEAALQAMFDTVDKAPDFVSADARFHTAVLRAAHNEYFDTLQSAIFAGLLMSIKMTNPSAEQNVTSIPPHAAVEATIRRQDGNGAFEAMQNLLEDASSRLRKALAASP